MRFLWHSKWGKTCLHNCFPLSSFSFLASNRLTLSLYSLLPKSLTDLKLINMELFSQATQSTLLQRLSFSFPYLWHWVLLVSPVFPLLTIPPSGFFLALKPQILTFRSIFYFLKGSFYLRFFKSHFLKLFLECLFFTLASFCIFFYWWFSHLNVSFPQLWV